jgi:aspartyl-tRNA(Asn)/glutamyl-tRNA(Gln) amidotransferase subunit B
VRRSMPEVPETRAQRYVDQYGIPGQAAGELARDPALSSFFERTVQVYDRPSEVANWLIGEFREQIRAIVADGEAKVTPEGLSELLGMVDRGKATRMQAKALFREMLTTGKSASQLAGAGEVSVFTDEAAISRLVDTVLSEGGALQDAKNNPRALNYLIGQVLKREPRAEPKLIAKLLASKLKR